VHLAELTGANLVLIEAMKRSCREDEMVHQILNRKLEALDSILTKTAIMPYGTVYKKQSVLQ
jgi:hypothetical protein